MNDHVRRFPFRGVVITTVVLVSLLLILIGMKPVLWPDYHDSGIKTAPAPIVTHDSTYGQDERELRPTRRPAVTPTPTPTILDPKGKPTKLEIFEGKKRLLAMNIDKQGTANGKPFASDCGLMTWYSAKRWPTPGTLSAKKSLITGHGWCRGEIYELDKLRMSSKNAVLRITFDSGDVVIGEATMAAVAIDKTKLNKVHDNVYNDGDGRMIRVSTCDSTSGKRPDGHAKDNIFQLFTVVKVIKK